MTVVVEETEAAPVVEEAAPNNLARWHIRAAAFVVDVLPGVAVVATMALVWLAVPLRSTWWWLCVSVLAAATLLTLINRVVWPANRGWSLGRALMGIVVVRPDGTSADWGDCCERPRPPARHHLGIRRLAVAAVGPTPADLRRLAAPHRGAPRRTKSAARQASARAPQSSWRPRRCCASPVPG